MVCSRCEVVWSEVERKHGALVSQVEGPISRLGSLYCERCGSALPLTSATETLLDKLSQLARFGLSAGGRPILDAGGGSARQPERCVDP